MRMRMRIKMNIEHAKSIIRSKETEREREEKRVEAIMVFNLQRDTGKMGYIYSIYMKWRAHSNAIGRLKSFHMNCSRMTNESNGKRTYFIVKSSNNQCLILFIHPFNGWVLEPTGQSESDSQIDRRYRDRKRKRGKEVHKQLLIDWVKKSATALIHIHKHAHTHTHLYDYIYMQCSSHAMFGIQAKWFI